MATVFAYLRRPACWAHLCTAQNNSSESADHAAGVQCHWEVTAESLKRWIADDQDYVVGALGRDGPALLRQQWTTIGATVERRGRIAMGQILTDLTNQLHT